MTTMSGDGAKDAAQRLGPEESASAAPDTAMLDPSSAIPATPASRAETMRAAIPVRNVLTVFAAHFHVRRGNEIVWAHGTHSVQQLAKAGIEWKVLPSGSHLVERDVVYFEYDGSEETASDTQHRNTLFGIAAFKNKKLGADDQSGAVSGEADDQRGARMTAVGAMVECGSNLSPWTQLAATVPHIEQLRKLTDAYSADPTCLQILTEWYDVHKHTTAFLPDTQRFMGSDAMPSPMYAHDPLYMLPAVSNCLGPLLPGLLKQLLVASQRLLIYIPHGVSTVQAASIAFNIGEMAQAACQASFMSKGDDSVASGSRACHAEHFKSHGLTIRGIIGLHDVSKLHDEDKGRVHVSKGGPSWIAWTSDRILLEKPELYDVLLDLTPIAEHQLSSTNATHRDEYNAPAALPKLMRVHREVVDGRQRSSLRKQTWTTREFAVYRGMDEQASMQSTSVRHVRRALNRRLSQMPVKRSMSEPCPIERPEDRAETRAVMAGKRKQSTMNKRLNLFTLLRLWLSSLWIFPRRWRINLSSSYGYVPLSIRSDGGIRASIMLLPDSDIESSDGEDSESEIGNTSRISRRSLPQSPNNIRSNSLGDVFDDDDAMRGQFIDDPILAAAGAGSVASNNRRRRKSRSMASQSATTRHMADTADGEPTVLPVTPMSSARHSLARSESGESVFSGDEGARRRKLEELQEARESISLALCLFASWSEWISDLVQEVLDLVQEKAESQDLQLYGLVCGGEGEDASNTTARGHDAVKRRNDSARSNDPASSNPTENGATLELSSSDLRDVGLSSSNLVDVELVKFLSSSVTDADIVVRKSWPGLSLFGW